MARVKILIVEDEAIVARHIENSLKSLGYAVLGIARSGEQALQKTSQASPDLVLMDIHLKGDLDGVEAAERIRSRFDVPVVYLTAYADERTVERAKLSEPFGYIFKPFKSRDLRVNIEIALYRHRMEQKVRESEALARALLDARTDAVVLLDVDRNVLDVNRTVAERLGQPREALIGQPLSELFPSGLLQSRAAHMARVLSSGEPARFEVEHQGVWLDTVLHPILDAGGQVVKVAVFSRDITERVQSGQEVEQSRQFLQSVLDALPAHVAILDASGTILSVNASWRRFARENDLAWSGYGVGRNYLKVCDTASGEEADQARRAAQGIRQVIAGRRDGFYLEYACHSLDEQRWFTMRVARFGSNGSTRVVVTHESITEGVQTAAKLRQLSQAVEQSPATVVITDTQGQIEYVNPRFSQVTGYTSEEALGKNPRLLKSGRHPPEFYRELWDTILTGGEWRGEFINRRKDGETYWEAASISPLVDADGTITHFVKVAEDVTDRVRAEEALEERVKELTCLYAVSRDIQRDLSVDELCRRAVEHLVPAMRFPEITAAVIELDDQRFTSKNYTRGLSHGLGAEIRVDGEPRGCLGVYYREEKPFLIPEEQDLINVVAEALSLWLERMQAESQRQAALEALRIKDSAIESSISAVALSDLAGNLTYVNDAFLKLWGYDERQQVLGRPVVEFWDAREEAAAVVDALFNQGGWVGELVAKRKDGSLRPVQLFASLVTDGEGTPIRLMASFLDITEQRLTRRFMETRLSLIEYAAGHTLDELLTRALDEVGAFVDSPIGFYHFVEPDQKTLSLQQWSTRTLQEFCQTEGRGLHYGIDQAGVWVDCVDEKRPVIHNDYASLPHKKGTPDGHAELIRELVVPVMRDDQVVAILGVGNKPSDYTHKDAEIVSYLADVTWEIVRQKRADEALQRYAEELERRNQEIQQFVHIVSHDLRTPLFNLKGFANILSDAMEVMTPAVEATLPGLDEVQRQAVTRAWQEDVPEALEFIHASVTKMDRFIKAVLKLSRLGRHALELEPVDMEALVRGTLDTLAHKIQDRQVQVTVGPLPTVVADWLSMEQIMGNLLSNAVLYLDPDRPGQIEVTGERRPDETLFYVRDNGVGIAPEDASQVFAPFRRVGAQDVPGEGMGLAYVQTLVRRHQGRIWFESELGAGTTFVFSISNHLNNT